MSLHPRLSLHEVCFPASMDVAAILGWAEQNGVAQIGLFSLRRGGDWSEAVAAAARSPVKIAYISHASMFRLEEPSSWETTGAAMMQSIDAAKQVGAPMVYATTGPAGQLEFDEAVESLAQAVAPVREHAASAGVQLVLETTQPNFCFTHFLHTFQDTVEVADRLGFKVCFDLWPTWNERDIRRKAVEAVDRTVLIQVSDHIPRNLTPARDVVGAGVIPIKRLLQAVVDAGYRGVFDLELFGRPDETAAHDALVSARALDTILHEIDA